MSTEALHDAAALVPPYAMGLSEHDVAIVSPVFRDEQVVRTEPIVRGATMDDLGALTNIELSAYSGVYGTEPDAATVEAVHNKYRERIELLGGFVRVVEDPEGDVFGMIVCCPTNLDREHFLRTDTDMTDNDNIRAAYDPNGRRGYIVNLAVRPDRQGGGEVNRLFMDAIVVGVEQGVTNVFFESRLPGFGRWAQKQAGGEAELAALSDAELDSLAQTYWTTTREGADGLRKPVDPLLRKYVVLGAKTLKLVKDAWRPDVPSAGYGVLCEFELPQQESAAVEPEVVLAEAGITPEAVTDIASIEAPESSVAGRGIFKWIKAKRKALLLGTALTSLAVTTATGAPQEIIDEAGQSLPWVAGAYGASMAAYFASAGVMLAAAGRNVRNIFKLKEELPFIAEKARESTAIKVGFWANTASAIGAASIATAGIVESLPPSAWGALVIPAADLYSTVVLRKWLHDRISRKD